MITTHKPTGKLIVKEPLDDRPYPVNLWEWTKDEFRRFLFEYRFPGCTITDRMRHHEQVVINALHAGHNVPAEVLADYPNAKAAAQAKHNADAAMEKIRWDREVQIAAFSARLDAGLRDQLIAGIREQVARRRINIDRHSAPGARQWVTFEADNDHFTARLVRFASDQWSMVVDERWDVRYGTEAHHEYGLSPLTSLRHDEVFPPQPVRIYDSEQHAVAS